MVIEGVSDEMGRWSMVEGANHERSNIKSHKKDEEQMKSKRDYSFCLCLPFFNFLYFNGFSLYS